MATKAELELWQAHVRGCARCEAEALIGLTEEHSIDVEKLCYEGMKLFLSLAA